jgi:hypothetical protein
MSTSQPRPVDPEGFSALQRFTMYETAVVSAAQHSIASHSDQGGLVGCLLSLSPRPTAVLYR